MPDHGHHADPAFAFDYHALTGAAYDFGDGERLSTYWDLEPLQRGPQPPPGWLVTDRAAVDTDLGILKTGKEADVVLLERAVPGTSQAVVLAAKRYRSAERRDFQRSVAYTDGRSVKRARDERALKRKSTWGRVVAAAEWVGAEWSALVRCWTAGVPVPYPVQVDGQEILMELVTNENGPAPRLAQTRPAHALLASYFEQLRDAMRTLAGLGFAHGDLSPYNLLAAGDRLVLIDLPQLVDLAGNAAGGDFLLRDCENVCSWFNRRGLEVDAHDLYADLLVSAWG